MKVAITVVVDISDPSSFSSRSPLDYARSEVDRWLCMLNEHRDCYGIRFDLDTLSVGNADALTVLGPEYTQGPSLADFESLEAFHKYLYDATGVEAGAVEVLPLVGEMMRRAKQNSARGES